MILTTLTERAPVKKMLPCALFFVLSLVGLDQARAQKLPDGPGKDTLTKVCGACHEAEIVAGQSRTRDAWFKVINDMLALGADGTDDELKSILDYLSTTFPKKVNVNKAPAAELQSVLELSTKTAEDIVTYRDKNGAFKTLDDLKKVPGLDSQKMETEKNRIVF
jgi:competence protein ComEA